jgi:hypothetical protein
VDGKNLDIKHLGKNGLATKSSPRKDSCLIPADYVERIKTSVSMNKSAFTMQKISQDETFEN